MNKPELSIIIIVYNMVEQAMNTLYSLSAAYQQNVSSEDYEIIIVENHSANTLDPEEIKQLQGNFKYFLREETGVSPAPAINFGFDQCQADYLGLMIDGARLLSPRVIENALFAKRISANAFVATPVYDLGPHEQRFNLTFSYSREQEKKLLAESNWKENGYALFDICTLGAANMIGFLNPMMESNCMFFSRSAFLDIGKADESFTHLGGGCINLDIFRSLGLSKISDRFFILPFEGSFHQFHSGVSTSEEKHNEENLADAREHLQKKWNNTFTVLRREPSLLGAINSHAMDFLNRASEEAEDRFKRLDKKQQGYWDDSAAGNWFSPEYLLSLEKNTP